MALFYQAGCIRDGDGDWPNREMRQWNVLLDGILLGCKSWNSTFLKMLLDLRKQGAVGSRVPRGYERPPNFSDRPFCGNRVIQNVLPYLRVIPVKRLDERPALSR